MIIILFKQQGNGQNNKPKRTLKRDDRNYVKKRDIRYCIELRDTNDKNNEPETL